MTYLRYYSGEGEKKDKRSQSGQPAIRSIFCARSARVEAGYCTSGSSVTITQQVRSFTKSEVSLQNYKRIGNTRSSDHTLPD